MFHCKSDCSQDFGMDRDACKTSRSIWVDANIVQLLLIKQLSPLFFWPRNIKSRTWLSAYYFALNFALNFKACPSEKILMNQSWSINHHCKSLIILIMFLKDSTSSPALWLVVCIMQNFVIASLQPRFRAKLFFFHNERDIS